MSTSPRPPGRSRQTVRIAFVVAAVFAAVSSTTAVAGPDPAPQAGPDNQTQVVARQPSLAEPALLTVPPSTDPCSPYLADYCVEVPTPKPAPVDRVAACTFGGTHMPSASLQVSPGTEGDAGIANAVRIRVETEIGLAVDGECFANEVLSILQDERGWSDIDNVTFVRVDGESYDLRLVLASPETTDSLCHPANTAGKYSCRNGDSVIINLMRWESGTDDYVGDLATYRRYLINHEVGHFLGKGHLGCPAAGEPAPVMMQQTKGLGDCLPNGWPTKDEH